MGKLQFKTTINAPVAKVYDIMLGEKTFKQWTAIFNPTSDFEGSWEKGEKVLFVGTDDTGKKGGMIGKIKENIPNQFVSIEYIGVLDGDNELYEGPATIGWVGTYENYSFEEKNGITTVTVDIEVNDSMTDYFKDTYPRALDKLKEIIES